MSEIEKAIKIAEDKNICEFCEDCGNDDVCIKCEKVSPVPIDDLRNFYSVAIQALQEKAERENLQEECRYCNDTSFKQLGKYVDSTEGSEILEINHYCINCGRKLVEE